MVPSIRCATLSLLLLLLLLLVSPALAQEADRDPGTRPPERQQIFIDRVDVNVVNVEVFVTDGQGRRVADLTADEFALFEDGRPVEISNFYAVTRPGRVESGFAEDRALVRGEAPPRPELPDDQQLSLLVYVDNFNLRPGTRNRVLDQMQGFLEDRVIQGDRVMLVTYNRKIDVIEPFTRDRERLWDGVRRIRKMSGYRQLKEAERREVLRNANLAVGSFDVDGGYSAALDYVRSYIEGVQEDLEHSIKALRDMTRSLAGLPGRKAFLYVSDGLAQNPGQELYEHVISLFPRGTTAGGRSIDLPIAITDYYQPEIFAGLVADANAHQVTFYTLDARGSTAGGTFLSAEHETLGAEGGGTGDIDAIREANLKARMIDIAESTGGTAIRSTQNFDGALARISGDFDSFYSLGYRSPRGGDGKYHKIEVKAKRPGLVVRHRSGYVDKPEAERVADRTLSSLLLEIENNPLGVGVDFGPPVKTGRGEFVLPLIIRIPVRGLTLLPQGQAEQGKLTIFLAVRDEKGGISDLHQFPLPLSFPRQQVAKARGSEIAYRTNLKLGKGTPKIAVGVWDELSGTESFHHQRVLVNGKKKV